MEKKHIYWDTYKGKRIIRINYAGLGGKEGEEYTLQVLDKVHDFVLKAGKNLLILVDVEDAYATSKIVAKLKSNVKSEGKLIKKEAILGLNKAKTILLNSINMFAKTGLKPFNTEKEALKWLIKDDD